MKTITAYDRFVSKVNALDTSRGVNPDIRQFVFIFNEEMFKWEEERQQKDDSNQRIEGLQELLVSYFPMTKAPHRTDVEYTSFDLPDDYFLRVGAVIAAMHKERRCPGSINVELVKPKEAEIKLTNVFHRPSFDMEQSIGFLSGNKLNVYEGEDHTIEAAYFSYYKIPSPVDLAGYINEEGIPSTTKDTELSTSLMNEIIDRAATEFYIRNTDQIRTQMAQLAERKT